MKKILVIHLALVLGGAETVLISYLNILSKHYDKYAIELVLLENRQNHRINEIPSNIKISHLLTEIESEFFLYCYNRREQSNYHNSWRLGCQDKIKNLLLEKINSNNYDLIIEFHYNYSNFEYFLNEYDVHIPIIKWCHGIIHIDRWRDNPDYYKYILSKYNIIVSIADEMSSGVNKVLSNFGLEEKIRCKRLYNPIDINNIIEKSNENVANPSLLQNDFILHVSTLYKHKNALELVDIYHKLKQKGIKEKLYIIGEGEQSEDIKSRIIELGLENDCLLLGRIDNPLPFMKRAKLFLFSSFSEGLPTVFLESMACGTPVISYDCPTGPKDILDNGKYGALIPLSDHDTFIKKAYELLTQSDIYQKYIDLLPEAIARFSSDTIEKELISLIDTTMKHN